MNQFNLARSVTWLAANILLLSACSQQSPSSEQEKTELTQTESPQAESSLNAGSLRDVPRPNPDSMEADVGTFLTAKWNELDGVLGDVNLSPDERAQAYANYGLAAFGNGLVLPAEMAFENATHLAPNDVRWIYFSALLHEYKGNLDKAVLGFQQVLEMRPDDLPTLIRLGDVRFEQARMDEAQQLFRRALAIKSDSAAVLYRLGRVASGKGEFQDAVRHFQAALALEPYADRINYMLGLALRNLGEREQAQAYLAKRGTNEPHFEDPLFDKISGGKARIAGLWTHMTAGSQAYVDGNYALAIDEFQLATKAHPDDLRSWQSLGMALNKADKNIESQAAYSKALEINEGNAVVHHELAKLLVITGDLQAAEQHLIRALEIDPRMLAAHNSLARLLIDSGRLDAALQRYDVALALDPQSAELAVARAELLDSLGRSEDAIAAFEKAASINPNNADIRIAFTLALLSAKQPELAMAQIQEAIKLAENDLERAHAYYGLGRVQLHKGEPQAAITSFGSALKLNSRHRGAGLELARSHLRIRDFKQALAIYKVLINHWPQEDFIRIEAAKTALQLGDGVTARNILELAASQQSASPRLLGSFARLMVLSTQAGVRDPDLALKFAQRALSKSAAIANQETLALCHAALGDFSRAVETQQDLLKNVDSQVAPNVLARMQKNLQRYRAKTLGRLPFDAS